MKRAKNLQIHLKDCYKKTDERDNFAWKVFVVKLLAIESCCHNDDKADDVSESNNDDDDDDDDDDGNEDDDDDDDDDTYYKAYCETLKRD